MHRLIKKSGIERVSDESTIALALALERIASKISNEAKRYAYHAGRKTIKKEDIDLAVNSLYYTRNLGV